MTSARAIGCGMLLCMLTGVASAQNLPDPTRPPAGIYSELTGQGGGQAGQATAPPSSGLQTVIVSADRRSAIINGKMIELGEEFGNARLIEVSERGIVLQGKHGKRELALFPGVHLRMKAAASRQTDPANSAPEDKE